MRALDRTELPAAAPVRNTLSPTLVDLHCHILPGLDDGPVNLDFSMLMARRAAEAGTQMIVATPHIRDDYAVPATAIDASVGALNEQIEKEGLPLTVMAGGEVALTKAAALPDEELSRFTLAGGRSLLLESPFRRDTIDVEATIADVQSRGYTAILAHPERCHLFLNQPERLERLVESGVMCSLTAVSIAGGFGDRVRRFSLRLLAGGLVHNIASDAHDHLHRPPTLLEHLIDTEDEIPGFDRQRAWYTTTAPVAILADRPLPARPPLPEVKQSGWRRLLSRGR